MKFVLCFLSIIGFASAQFSATGQDAIVKFHNDLRSSIAKGMFTAAGKSKPSAANMLKMKWDPTIADTAQKFTDTCQYRHSGTPNVGENLFSFWSSDAPTNLDSYGTIAPKSWADEFQRGWDSNIFSQSSSTAGIVHATQMVWANTYLIGCGVKNCGKDASRGNLYKVAVVCHYSPPGNWIGQDVYQAGNSCSVCRSNGYKCETDTGLCV